MNHHDNNTPLLGAILGAIGGIYKSMVSAILIISWSGILETAFYAIIGAGIGAVASFFVTYGLKKLFRIKK